MALTSKLEVEGDRVSESFFRRFGEGSSEVEDAGRVGEEAAALCMNFIVNSLEDIDFGALPGVLVPLDILKVECTGGCIFVVRFASRGMVVCLC